MIAAIAHQKGGVGKSAIAWHLSMTLNPTLLIDLDFQESCSDFNRLRELSGKAPLPVRRIKSANDLKELIDNDTDDQLIIIDLGGFDSDVTRMAIATADLIITPIYDLPTEIRGVARFKTILNEIGQSIGEPVTASVLINKVHPARKRYDEITDAITGLGFNVMDTKIIQSNSIAESVGEGLSLREFKSASKHRAIQCFDRLADEVRDLLATS